MWEDSALWGSSHAEICKIEIVAESGLNLVMSEEAII